MQSPSRIATFVRAYASGLSLALLSASCLVTNKVDYEEPFIPSTIRRLQPAQQIVRAPPVIDQECQERRLDGYMYFQVSINDLNAEEDLQLRVHVNDMYETDRLITPPERPLVEFCVNELSLSQPCNRVQVLVTSRFKSAGTPERSLELATAQWLVLAKGIEDPTASHLDCEEDLRDAGAP